MSGLSLSVDVVSAVSPRVRGVIDLLTNFRGIHDAMGYAGRTLTRDHLIGLAGTRHGSANRLGAAPSGHWAQAVEKTTFAADAHSATISISHPGIGRAMHDVDIYPSGGAKNITIPLIAQAYNLRAASVWESQGLFVVKGKTSAGNSGAVAVKRLPDGTLQPWYLLLPHVHQKQDRSLLPSNTEYERAAVDGAINYLQMAQRSLS